MSTLLERAKLVAKYKRMSLAQLQENIGLSVGHFYNIKVEPEAMEVIERYRGTEHLIKQFDKNVSYLSFIQSINHSLREICKNIGIPEVTTYWARHTFATIAYEIGISMDVIADCLGHKSAHRITSIYVRKDQQLIDDANRKVIDYVLYNKKG